MLQQNKQGRLADSQKAEFSELLSAASIVALFTFANMLGFLVRGSGEPDTQEIEVGDAEEIVLDDPNTALKGAVWELDRKIALHADGDAKLAAVVDAYAETLMNEIALRAAGARQLDAFVARTYRVEADDFQIDGFTPARRAAAQSLTMTFKKPEEVIGNHIAKHQCLKLAKMLMAYDFTRQLNPFVELGGFIFTFLGDGKPGTGKTTLIQMLAGLLKDYCDAAGYPFRYENLSARRSIPIRANRRRTPRRSSRRSWTRMSSAWAPSTISTRSPAARRPAVLLRPAGDHRRSDGELRRRQYRGARQLQLRHVLKLPGERRRRPAPAGRRPLPGRRAAERGRLHRHPAPAAGLQSQDPGRQARSVRRPGDPPCRLAILREAQPAGRAAAAGAAGRGRQAGRQTRHHRQAGRLSEGDPGGR